jgi:RNA polymerase primary sigma factor
LAVENTLSPTNVKALRRSPILKKKEPIKTGDIVKKEKQTTPKKPADKAVKYLTDEGSLSLYLREISKSKSLNPQEEAELAILIRKSDRRALNKLIKANLKFVVSVCKNYQNQGLPLTDLINEGNLGLIRAAKRFDETKHFKFISYAVWWVRQAILQALAEHSRIIKLPPNRVGTIHKIGKTISVLEQKSGRTPTLEEISKSLNLKEEEINEVLKISNPYMSLDSPIQKGDESCLIDVLKDDTLDSPDKSIMDIALNKEIINVLSTLDGKEKEVIKLYFGIGVDTAYTLEEIGHKFNLTRERVRQIKEKAIKRLKHTSRSKKLILFKA